MPLRSLVGSLQEMGEDCFVIVIVDNIVPGHKCNLQAMGKMYRWPLTALSNAYSPKRRWHGYNSVTEFLIMPYR